MVGWCGGECDGVFHQNYLQLRVWSDGIRLALTHATLLTLFTMCVLLREPWSGFSAACTSRVSTLLSHHLFASTKNGGCLNIK